MTRRSFITRLATFILLAIAFLAAPSGVQAQDDNCLCDHITISLSANSPCRITVAWAHTPLGALLSRTIAPGESFRINCPLYEVYVITCTGAYRIYPIDPAGARCTPGLSLGSGCCLRACYGLDREGCQTINFEPADCTGADC